MNRPVMVQSRTKKYNVLPFLLGAMALVGTIIAISLSRAPHQAPESPQRTPAEARTLYAKLDTILAAARIAAKGEPATEQMVEDFSHQVVVGRMSVYNQIEYVSRRGKKKQDAVSLVFISRKKLDLIPDKLDSLFLFEPSLNAIIFTDVESVSAGVLASIFLHELVHWRSFVDRGKTITTTASVEDILKEEVRAYDLEFRAIDRQTRGAFNRTIADVLRDDTLSSRVGLEPRYANAAGWKRLLAIWSDPPQSAFELDIRRSGLIIAFQFAQVSDEQSKMRIYANVRRQIAGRDYRNESIY